MGAPMGNKNAAGPHRGVSKGAKKYLSLASGRYRWTKKAQSGWAKKLSRKQLNKELRNYRYFQRPER
jgi:hypothetical protein